MRSVEPKTAEQQSQAIVPRTRKQFVHQRTEAIKAMRSHRRAPGQARAPGDDGRRNQRHARHRDDPQQSAPRFALRAGRGEGRTASLADAAALLAQNCHGISGRICCGRCNANSGRDAFDHECPHIRGFVSHWDDCGVLGRGRPFVHLLDAVECDDGVRPERSIALQPDDLPWPH